MFLYAISRFVIEIYRGDPRGEILGFSTSQFISLVLAPLSLVMLVWLSRQRRPETPAGKCSGAVRLCGVSRGVPLEFTVPSDFDGQRLDRFLVSVLDGHSRSQIQKLIADGHVTVERRDAQPNLTMREGERVTVDLPDVEPATAAAEALPLEILYQDADLAVLNKPAGWSCIRAPATRPARSSTRCSTTSRI